jgi:tRNA (guanine37-N1)-methyltransferase
VLIHVLTIHPAILTSPLRESILRRAQEANLLDVRVVNIRDFAFSKHQTTDDYPYGGGAGLVMKPEPVFEAVDWCVRRAGPGRVILLDPQGERLTQRKAEQLAREEHLVLVCGRYEGFDERIRQLASDEISIGDYVLMGGELPALVLVEAVARLVPGVLGDQASAAFESHTSGLLEGPSYTRPVEYRGMRVPDVLLSGDHGAVARWRRREALRRTLERRPELLAQAPLTEEDRTLLAELKGQAPAARPKRQRPGPG